MEVSVEDWGRRKNEDEREQRSGVYALKSEGRTFSEDASLEPRLTSDSSTFSSLEEVRDCSEAAVEERDLREASSEGRVDCFWMC